MMDGTVEELETAGPEAPATEGMDGAAPSATTIDEDGIPLPGRSGGPEGPGVPPLRLLVVDDDAVDRQSVRRMLRRAQLEVEIVEAETVAGATAVLDHGAPIDCVLLDQNLPDGDGLELLARLHDDAGLSPPIIVLTMQDEAALADRCLHLGAQDYLVKGRFDADGLVRAIRYARERFLLVQELAHKAHALARSNVELERFASIASHDLQEPLRTLAAMGARLSQRFDGALGVEGRELVQRMVDASQRMRGLVGDLLELSRAARGEVPRARVDLRALIDRVRCDLGTRFEETGAELRLPPELPHVLGDPPTLTRLFQNLLGNSLKFCHAGRRPVLAVNASAVRRGAPDRSGVRLSTPRVEVVLEDNGIGFDPGQAEAIFEPFKRLQPRTRFPGSGMGLAIARAIVERHGGRIWAVGRPGEGATFCLTLPAADG
jgi:signal transduction histidine kinase